MGAVPRPTRKEKLMKKTKTTFIHKTRARVRREREKIRTREKQRWRRIDLLVFLTPNGSNSAASGILETFVTLQGAIRVQTKRQNSTKNAQQPECYAAHNNNSAAKETHDSTSTCRLIPAPTQPPAHPAQQLNTTRLEATSTPAKE